MQATVEVDGRAVPPECYYEGDGDVQRVSVVVDDEGVLQPYRCMHCGAGTDDRETPDDECTDSAGHEWQYQPLTWLNHAAVSLDETEDSVTVSISVGDPRGGFAFTVRRMPDGAADPGRLIMHVPHPGEMLPHATLTPLHDGTYAIG